MSGLRLSVGEWAILTQAIGVFLGQTEYLAGEKTEGVFADTVKATNELVEKLDGTQYLTYGQARVSVAVRQIADSEKRLQAKMDGLK